MLLRMAAATMIMTTITTQAMPHLPKRPPAIEELVVDDALLTQPLLSSQGTFSTASLEQKKNNSVASTSSAAAAAAGVDKGQREGIV
jgi:hypothetical protein